MAVNAAGFSEGPGCWEVEASPGTFQHLQDQTESTEQQIINSTSKCFSDLPYEQRLVTFINSFQLAAILLIYITWKKPNKTLFKILY